MVVSKRGYDPKLVFCHPDLLLWDPSTSLYYRGLCGLSIKAAKDYFGSIERLEQGVSTARLDSKKAVRMAQVYNTFICPIVKNSTGWTLEDGYRTVIATLGISLDGVMRNKVGKIGEERVRTLILEWLIDCRLIVEPKLKKEQIYDRLPRSCVLKKNILMTFGSDPDISFKRNDSLLAVIEIKGGIDPAGALERYGAAKKSFEHSVSLGHQCKNFYLGAVFTRELERRIKEDRLVEKYFDIIKILDDPTARAEFFDEVFHHALRLI